MDELECPHCGEVLDDASAWCHMLRVGDSHTGVCPECGKWFICRVTGSQTTIGPYDPWGEDL